MRWTTVVLGLLLLCLLVMLWVLASPYAALLLTVHQHSDVTTSLIHTLLTARTPNLITQKSTWVLLALMGVIVLVTRIRIWTCSVFGGDSNMEV